MKLWLLLAFCAVVAAAANLDVFESNEILFADNDLESPETRNILLNVLIRQLFAYIRLIINNGSDIFGLPPLDPLEIEEYHLVLPTGLVNLDLHLKNITAEGIGGFVVHKSNLNLRGDLTFDVDISVPKIYITADQYDLDGNLFTAIPLYGKGRAEFNVNQFRFRALLFLKQSEDGKSILIDRIENASYEIPYFKSNLDGAIGGGDIDGIVNKVIQEVLIKYVNRFQGAISKVVANAVVSLGNPLLDQLDTWRFIAPFL